MSEDVKKSPKVGRKAGAEAFRQQRTAARKRAMQFIYSLDVQKQQAFEAIQLDDFKEMLGDLEEDTEALSEHALEKSRQYMDASIAGVSGHLDELDALISKAAKNWSISRMGPVDRCILRVAAYEILYSENVSAATAIDEAVELAKGFGQPESPRFVNGVLDRIRRQKAEQTVQEPAPEPTEADAETETEADAETEAETEAES